MNVRPVIAREMLMEARRPATVYARLFLPMIGMVAFLLFAMGRQYDSTTGSELFYRIHSLFFWTIWCAIPLLTADTLSRERRENTLGLLFLTGLSGHDIVLGKSCAHGLRGLNLLLAMIPFSIVPVVLGGVSSAELMVGFLVNSGAVILALAAGMLASAMSRSWWRALPLALLIGGMLLAVFSTVLYLSHEANYTPTTIAIAPTPPIPVSGSFPPQTGATQPSSLQLITQTVTPNTTVPAPFILEPSYTYWINSSWIDRLAMQFGAISTPFLKPEIRTRWGTAPASPSLPGQSLRAAAAGLASAAVLAWLALGLAARITALSWGRHPPSPRMLRWRQFWVAERFLRAFLHQRLAGTLNRNPIGWLHQRSWKARLEKWGWFLLGAFVGALLLQELLVQDVGLPGALRLLGTAMLMGMAFSAATSFRQDFESGTMEILLVSPLPTRDILSGRLRGIIEQYLPASSILLLIWLAVYWDIPQQFFRLQGMLHPSDVIHFATSAMTLITVGLYQSVKHRAALWAWLITLVEAWLLPRLATDALILLVLTDFDLSNLIHTPGYFDRASANWTCTFLGLQALVAGLTWSRANTQLSRRDFVFPGKSFP